MLVLLLVREGESTKARSKAETKEEESLRGAFACLALEPVAAAALGRAASATESGTLVARQAGTSSLALLACSMMRMTLMLEPDALSCLLTTKSEAVLLHDEERRQAKRAGDQTETRPAQRTSVP